MNNDLDTLMAKREELQAHSFDTVERLSQLDIEIERLEESKCKTCDGLGTVPSVHPHDSAYYGENRPCPDCKEKPEIVECEVKLSIGEVWESDGDTPKVFNDPYEGLKDRRCIGIESDGILYGRLYKCKDTGEILSMIRKDRLHLYEVLTPTHVLFRKG